MGAILVSVIWGIGSTGILVVLATVGFTDAEVLAVGIGLVATDLAVVSLLIGFSIYGLLAAVGTYVLAVLVGLVAFSVVDLGLTLL